MTSVVAPGPGIVDHIGARRELVRRTAQRSLGRRRVLGRIAVVLCAVAVAISLAPLIAIVAYTTARGVHAWSVDFFTHVPTPPGIPGGGISNAIVGSVVIVGIAAVIAVPVGIVAALFLLERQGRIAATLRFCADVLAGVPSIAMGIFAYTVIIEPIGHFAAIAGSFALAVLMLPIIVRSSEAAMRAVPREVWEAGLALGVRRSRVVRSVVLRGALPGLVTGNLLALARAVGETAPLLFVTSSTLWALNPTQPMGALPLYIYSFATEPSTAAQTTAWGTALLLLVLVLVLSIVARVVANRLNRRAR